jgi:hypothetical protein
VIWDWVPPPLVAGHDALQGLESPTNLDGSRYCAEARPAHLAEPTTTA